MNKISETLLLLCLLTFFISCNKNQTDPEQDPTVLNKKIILSPATKEPEKLQNVTTVNVDSSKLVIQFSNNNTPTYKKGDILIGCTGEGYLRKIETVIKAGNTLTITTSNASLEEAFTKLEIDTSLIFYPAVEQIAPIKYTSIVSNGVQKHKLSIECLNPQIATKALSESMSFYLPNVNYTLESADQANSLEVNIELVKVTFKIQAKELVTKLLSGQNNHIKIVYRVTSETEYKNISMVFKGGISGSIPEDDDLFKKDISLGTYLIPGTPIPLHFSFNLGLGIEASFLVGFGANMYSSSTITNNYDVGAEYVYGGWNGIWEKSTINTSTVDFKPISNMAGDAKIYLKPKLKIKVADMIGPSLYVRGYLYGELVYPPIKAEVGVGIDGGLEFIIKAFKIDIANFQWIIAEKRWPFWSYSNSEPIVPSLVSPTNNSTGVSISPTLNWSCSDPDSDALKYDVYLSTFNPPLLPISSGQVLSSLSKSDLANDTKYYWSVKATDSRGAFTSGPVWSFTTEAAELPSITTSLITDITQTTASGGGTVSSDGGVQVTARGVCWSTAQNPTTDGNKTSNGTGTGSFTSSITGLIPGGTYYVRAYAINSQGTAYGSQVIFTTGQALSLASVITSAASNITTTGATLGGNVTSDGNANVTEKGVVYSTTQNPTTSNTKVPSGSGTGTFTINVSNLSNNTTYYARAYAINSQGTGYGSQVNFTTGVIPVAAFIGTPTTIKAGESVQFTDQSTHTPTSWNWNFGDGTTSTIRNPSNTYTTPGNYTVSLTSTNSFGSNTQTRTNYITVNSAGNNLSQDLYGYWPFDGNTNDESGNSINGTGYNAFSYVSGIKGNSIRFVGSSTNYGITNTGGHLLLPFINFGQFNSFSISLWVKEESMTYWHGTGYISFGDDRGCVGIQHNAPDGSINKTYISFSVGKIQNAYKTEWNSSYLNQWMMLTLVYEGGNVYAYKNGVLLGSKAQALDNGNIKGGIACHYFGQNYNYFVTRFTGSIDDVRLYSKALTPSEVFELFQLR